MPNVSEINVGDYMKRLTHQLAAIFLLILTMTENMV